MLLLVVLLLVLNSSLLELSFIIIRHFSLVVKNRYGYGRTCRTFGAGLASPDPLRDQLYNKQ